MPSSENVYSRLEGCRFQGEAGDPCIYRGRRDLYSSGMIRDLLDQVPLIEGDRHFDRDEDVLYYFQETYGDYLSDLGFVIKWYEGSTNYIDIEYETLGNIITFQEVNARLYPYMEQLLDEMIDSIHYLTYKTITSVPRYGLVRGEWVNVLEEDLDATPTTYRSYRGEEVQDIVPGAVPGALFYVNRDGSKSDTLSEYTEWSFLGDKHHAFD